MANYRNPNGYGSVVKLSGRRRNPYMVRKTVGWDDRAYPIYSIIGYYPSRKEALIALAEYNHSPYDVDLSKLTFQQLYDKWSMTELPKLKVSLARAHRTSYGYCKPLYDLPYKSIRKHHMQACIDACTKSASTQNNIRNLFKTLDKFAFDSEIISKCYSTNLTIKKQEATKPRSIYTDKEVKLLHSHISEPYIDETLFMLYTGMRISEMLSVRCDNVDLTEMTIRGGTKTSAGKNRLIPIHDKLQNVIREHFGKGEYLFNYQRSETAENPELALESTFMQRQKSALAELGIHHTSHECRHTFRSKLDSAGANKVCIDLLMGHKSADVGERIYTHKTIDELRKTIALLDYSV